MSGEKLKATITRSDVDGRLKAPPSKSYTHRAITCAALAEGTSTITNPLMCDDTVATIRVCKKLGAGVNHETDLVVEGTGALRTPDDVLDCGGAGTTLRFFTAISSLAPGVSVLTGNKSLRERPVGELLDALAQLEVTAVSTRGDGRPPVVVYGSTIAGGTVKIRGDISSQFISALLFVCPRALEETRIELTTGLQSKPYVEITLDVLSTFDIDIAASKDFGTFTIPPHQCFSPAGYTVPGDFSSAAFLLAAGALAGRVRVSRLASDARQGDAHIVQILDDMGAHVHEKKESVTVETADLHAITIDASDVPDLAPVCAVLAAQAAGTTKIINAERLRLKESNRLASITTELKKMGGKIAETRDGLAIKGPTSLTGAHIDPHNDHRIAMACAVAGVVARGKTVIENMECTRKSYPGFVDDLKHIGVDVT